MWMTMIHPMWMTMINQIHCSGRRGSRTTLVPPPPPVSELKPVVDSPCPLEPDAEYLTEAFFNL